MSPPLSIRWADLLADAVNRPGLILEAYSRFHGYSLGNQAAAIFQCRIRDLAPGPIATLQRWNELGRRVKAGEKALVLCMPVSVRVKEDEAIRRSAPEGGAPRMRTVFVWKARWFVLGQTEGEPLTESVGIPSWDEDRALESLSIRRVPFDLVDGNVQGVSHGRTVAVSPLAALPAKTLLHELAHVLLGHCAERGADRPDLPKSLVEAEAEAVALLCLEALGLPGAEYARGYIQSWYGAGKALPEHSAQRIFKAADMILRAGRGQAQPGEALRSAA
ncbi:DUF1738 domain-containing protein [Acidobacteria bacterium ACD]|nr:MAG: DUF1738 domain-containing protein [Acidobacteriota bacterium]MCE7956476.1 DUF1738 domain-containing protein [Acidobacteria bacterium ACB2]MDL1948200.1 DUF1738 domain-containing protein [Acidobacteria bacterium ACD]